MKLNSMNKVRTASGAVAVTAIAIAVLAASSRDVAAQTAAAGLDCMIQPHQVVQVGSPAPGVIDKVLVDRGDVVDKGQPIVQFQAHVERAALAVARERAAHRGEATVATSTQELARRELERANELYEQNFVSKNYLDKQRAEAGVAGGRSDQAAERRSLATREVDLAAAQLEQRTIRAPIAGVVVERFMSPGEFVDQKPMLRIAAIDPLRIDVLVPAAAFGQVSVGMKGKVVPEILQRGVHAATVKTVDRVIDAASNTFRVRLELPNPGNALPAGLRCKVELEGLRLPPPPARESTAAANASVAAPAAAITPVVARR